MKTNWHKPPPLTGISTLFRGSVFFVLLWLSVLCFLTPATRAATFHGNADLTISDPTGALSWNSGNSALSVQCWFKISIPTGTNLTQNMVILVNGTSGSESQYAYLVRFNISNGNVEFLSQGSSGNYTNTLIQLPYLDRWYHLAIVGQQANFVGYVDGRQVFSGSGNAGNSPNTSGLSIGGWGNGQFLYGDVQEVSIYQSALPQAFIVQYMFDQQPTNDLTTGLVGYFPIGYSTNAAAELENIAPPTVPGEPSSAVQQVSGGVTFEQTDEGGEQSAFDAQRNGGRDALTPLSGAFSWQQTAFARPTPGVTMDFKFGYSSADNFGGFILGNANGNINPYTKYGTPLGGLWRHTFQIQVLPSADFSPGQDVTTVGLMTWDGAIETWDADDPDAITGSYHTRNGEYNGELVLTATNCQWTTPQRLVYVFKLPDTGSSIMRGRLTAIQDFNGNSVKVLWNQTTGILTQAVDSANGIYNFNYRGNSLLTNVTFGSWQVNLSYDATNRLISKSITNTAGLYGSVNTTWQFQYGTNGLLSGIIDPRGNTNVIVQYDQYGRQTNEVDALGRSTATLYEIPGERQITRIDPGTNSWVESYDPKGSLLAQQDPLGNITSYTYDTNENRTAIIEPLGWTTTFGYDARANVIAKTNALGEVTQWVFDSFFNKPLEKITPQPPDANGLTTWTNFYVYNSGGNLISNFDALGTLVSYTYSTNGLVLTSTDADGHTSGFGYNTNGFLTSSADAATNTTTYTVNDVDWKIKVADALGEPTSYTLDINGNPTRIQDAIGRIFTKSYDANGNLLSQSDGKGQLTTFAYDAANQKTNMVDRTGTNQWNYFYTVRGKLDHVTDPLGHSVTNIYDLANRLIQVTDPLGHSVTNQYDANGNLISFFDKTGRRWTKTFDRLNRDAAETDPLGNTKTTAFDVADRVRQINSPNGYPSLHTYDGRGRLIKWVDPMNYPWLYAYDSVGNITNITDALGGHYIMAYGSRNERTMEKNQDGFVWQYVYDPLMRLQQQTDPDGIVRTPTYDALGRVLFVNFSTGRQDSFDYDANDNPQTVSRRYSGVTTATQFIYDSLDRVVEQDDALGQTVLYGHDPLGRVTNITYPGSKTLTDNYDALGRLTSQTDWAGRQMSYIYDLSDRLISRTYPNGVIQTNSFDTSGRITGLSYSPSTVNSNSVNIALAYAYDRNGNKTGGGEVGTFNWPQPSLTTDQSGFTPAGRLISRQITETSPSNSVNAISYQYDASGNMTNAAGGGQTWVLTYDEDNRTTSINWDCGLTSVLVSNRYDALGRRISKTANGVTTGYVLDLSSGMERILCDLDGNGNVSAWYVHGPDLCYRVDATNGLICYHSDAMGNVIALTDGNTNLVAQYAYTPYGRSLGSTNTLSSLNSQPYAFVGSQGVQEESDIPNLYFMRARYYSADAGVFLSTDPVRHIGSSWEPAFFTYGLENPFRYTDPRGTSPGGPSPSDVLGSAFDIGDDFYQERQGQITRREWGEDLFVSSAEIIGIGALGIIGAPEVGTGAAITLTIIAVVDTSTEVANIAIEAAQGKGIPGLVLNDVENSTFDGPQSTPATINNQNIAGLNSDFASGKVSQPTSLQQANSGNSSSQTQAAGSGGGTIGGGTGGFSGNQSLSIPTVASACYVSAVNMVTATTQATPTLRSGSTSSSGSLLSSPSLSTGNSFSSQSTGMAGNTPATSIGQSSSTAATSSSSSSGGFFASLWSAITSAFR
jgi:RHS repeat-associated protein